MSYGLSYPPFSGFTGGAGGGGGGGGAPANAEYLVLALDGTLTNERRFVPVAGSLAATDGGAGGNYSLDLALAGTAGTYAYPTSLTTDTFGRVTAVTAGSAPVASGWTDGGTVVYLTTSTDDVSIGSNTPVTNRKLSIYNTGTDLGISVVTLASTDNVLETGVTAEANLRFSVNGAGSHLWGAGGGSALDVRLYRSATRTITVDDGAAGAAVFSVLGQTSIQRVQWSTVTTAASPYAVTGTDMVVLANPGAAQTVTLPAAAAGQLGRQIVVKRVNTSANVVTVNATSGNIDGAASLALPGGSYASITVVCDGTNWWVI